MTLTFTTKILHEGNLFDFLVEYDTINPNDNDIVNILYNGFTLDSVAMQFDHPAVYKQLEAAMENNSQTYWEGHTEPYIMPEMIEMYNSVEAFCEDYKTKLSQSKFNIL